MERVLIIVKFPPSLAVHFAQYTFASGIVVQLSYLKNEFFDGDKIYAYCAVEKEKEAAFTNEFKAYIQK